MRSSAQAVIALAVLSLGASTARAASPVDVKIAAASTAAKREQASWKQTRASLKGLTKRVGLRAALGQRGEHITLGERSGAHTETSVFYTKYFHLGLTEFSAHAPTKVEWKEQLVMGPRGLERLIHRRTAPVKRELLEAAVADLDAQFALKPDSIKLKVPTEHEPFGEFQLVSRVPVKTGVFSGRVQLEAERWGHLTTASIDRAVTAWGQE